MRNGQFIIYIIFYNLRFVQRLAVSLQLKSHLYVNEKLPPSPRVSVTQGKHISP